MHARLNAQHRRLDGLGRGHGRRLHRQRAWQRRRRWHPSTGRQPQPQPQPHQQPAGPGPAPSGTMIAVHVCPPSGVTWGLLYNWEPYVLKRRQAVLRARKTYLPLGDHDKTVDKLGSIGCQQAL